MPNIIFYLILVLILPIVLIMIGDKRIDKVKLLMSRGWKSILSLPKKFFALFKSKSPSGKAEGRFHSNYQKGKKRTGFSSKARFREAFDQHFDPESGRFREHDIYKISRRFYEEFSAFVESLNCNSFRSYRNHLCQQIHPDKSAQSHLTVDEATNVFQYFNQHFPRS